jgi:hypothetical protein
VLKVELSGTLGVVMHVRIEGLRIDVMFDVQSYAAFVPALIEIREHHYFCSEPAREWLISWTFEGDVDLLRGVVPRELGAR